MAKLNIGHATYQREEGGGVPDENRSQALAEYDRLKAENPNTVEGNAQKQAAKVARVSDRQVRTYLHQRENLQFPIGSP